ncbi:MAG TPA: NUDIX domain-containing protein [Tenuifilaceae bacterium]|nr:NUDIX domain-containing protein [Tenuifilaceae bacterium]
MTNDYKIFFGNRCIVITNNLKRNFLDYAGYYVGFDANTDTANLLQFFQNLKSLSSLYVIGENTNIIFNEFAKHFTIVKAAGGLVQNGNENFLMIKRNGLWDLPKGKVERDENVEQAAVREVIEECGLNEIMLEKHLLNTYHTYELNGKSILKKTSWYQMKSHSSGDLKPQVEENITEVCWVNKADVGKHIKNTYSSIVEVLKASGLV